MKHLLTILTLSLFTYTLCIYYDDNQTDTNFILNNFTFGSCYYGRLSTNLTIFNAIKQHHSNLWLWLGDAAYVDEPNLLYYYKQTHPNNWTRVEEIFNTSKSNKHYQEMISRTPVIGIWDDHDYGINDGNGLFAEKEIAKKYFLDFLDVPKQHHRRTQGKGIYATYSFGSGYKTVRLILLDVRYNKTTYFLNRNTDMLGEEQWQWFENVLRDANESFIFIGSGTQILPFNRIVSEAWYGNSRRRLFDLIGKYQKNGVILLTGDVHYAQISKTFCVLPNIGYDLYELTSSGLSHFLNVSYYVDKLLPNSYNYGPSYSGYNFGEVKINWGNSLIDSSVSLSIWDIDNKKQLEVVLKYEDLEFKRERISNHKEDLFNPSCTKRINKRFKTPFEYISYYMDHFDEIIIGLIYFGSLYLICHLLSSIKGAVSLGLVLFSVFVILAKYEESKQRWKHFKLSPNDMM